ncbi:MAG: hypothetical protein ACK5OA_06645, partial [Acidovorax sp.]
MKTVQKSAKLANVCYDIRGPIMDAAKQMEEEGHKIIKLNIGNLAVFGFDSPEEIQQDMIRNLPNSAGYSDSKGIFAARKAVMHETQKQGIKGVTLDDHRHWQQQIRTVTRSFAIGGLAILMLVGAATTAIIVSATRSALSANKEIVEVLHFVGATD